MAEKQCNLLKNGGGNGVKLRATATNSGSQTRSQVISLLYSAIQTAINEDMANCGTMFLMVGFGSGTVIEDYAFRFSGVILNATPNTYLFSCVTPFPNGTGEYAESIWISNTSAKFLYSNANLNSGWSNLADASNGTDVYSVRLYY